MARWLGWVVFRKELLDHARDHRSLLGTLVLPAVGPIVLAALFGLISDVQRARPSVVAVDGAAHAPELILHLQEHGVNIIAPPEDVRRAVEAGEQELVLVIPKDFEARLAAGRPPRLELYSNGSRAKSLANARRLESLLMAYSQELAALRLIARGVAPQLVQGLRVDSIEVASSQKRSAQLLTVVPLIIMLSALIGGMNIAIDTTAGERERGSLEPLLNNPISRWSLVLGKWLTTTVSSVFITALAAFGFMVAGQILPLEQLDIKVLLGPWQALQMFALALPLAPFGAALQMLVASTARTFKEAQTYLSLLNLLPMVPAVVLMLYPDQGQFWMVFVPTLAQIIAITDVLEAEPIGALRATAMVLSSLVYSFVMLALVARLFGRERTIFGR